jgi:single-strand DNA-binding protein
MSLNFNLVIFGGRLTNDPTALGDNGAGCKFDMASNRYYKTRDGERQEEATFMPVTCWGPLSEIVMKNCKKGDTVLVEGRIEVRKFTGDDGNSRKYVDIVAKDVRFLPNRQYVGKENNTETQNTAEPEPVLSEISDVPEESKRMVMELLFGNKKE